jgi:hypothetical protein
MKEGWGKPKGAQSARTKIVLFRRVRCAYSGVEHRIREHRAPKGEVHAAPEAHWLSSIFTATTPALVRRE